MNRTDDRAHTGRHDNYRQRDHRNRQNDDHRDRNTTDVRELARTIASLQAKLDSLQPGRKRRRYNKQTDERQSRLCRHQQDDLQMGSTATSPQQLEDASEVIGGTYRSSYG
jgi:hypothetical protein